MIRILLTALLLTLPLKVGTTMLPLAQDLSAIIKNTLSLLGERYDLRMNTPEAVELLVGTAITESNLRHLYQVRGPALSFFQIEPSTANDLIDNFILQRDDLHEALDFIAGGTDWVDNIDTALVNNIALASAFARLQYWRAPAAIPSDLLDQAKYWKKYYNSHLGKGKPEHYVVAVVNMRKAS